MSAKSIFILNGHPAESSLSQSFATTYAKAAEEAGHQVRLTHIRDISFDPDFGFAGYDQHKPLEPDLQQFQTDLEWSAHFVLTTPMWWGSMPAKLKGLIDRAFLPGWAFDPRTRKMGKPAPMLQGRSARAIVNSDTPDLFFGLFYRKAMLRQIKGQILEFTGMKPTKISHFSPAGKADAAKVTPWLNQVAELGKAGL